MSVGHPLAPDRASLKVTSSEVSVTTKVDPLVSYVATDRDDLHGAFESYGGRPLLGTRNESHSVAWPHEGCPLPKAIDGLSPIDGERRALLDEPVNAQEGVGVRRLVRSSRGRPSPQGPTRLALGESGYER